MEVVWKEGRVLSRIGDDGRTTGVVRVRVPPSSACRYDKLVTEVVSRTLYL